MANDSVPQNTKHTPAPWILSRTEYPVVQEQNIWVGTEDWPEAVACINGHQEDGEANARLIAAAPDMLEALKRAVDQYDDINVWLDQAKEAIAKAEGK